MLCVVVVVVRVGGVVVGLDHPSAGPPSAGRYWPHLAKPDLAEFGQFLFSEFGQTAFGQFLFLVGAWRGGVPKGWGPKGVWAQKGGGPERWGPEPRKSGSPKGWWPGGVGTEGVGARTQKKWGPEGWGAQNFAL